MRSLGGVACAGDAVENASSSGIVSGSAWFCSVTMDGAVTRLTQDGKDSSNIGSCQMSILMGYASYRVELNQQDSDLP